jgi:hypothetical protein
MHCDERLVRQGEASTNGSELSVLAVRRCGFGGRITELTEVSLLGLYRNPDVCSFLDSPFRDRAGAGRYG